MFLKEDQVLMG